MVGGSRLAFRLLGHTCPSPVETFSSGAGILPISKEINRKKESEAGGECLVPVNGYGHHFTQIDYLYYF
ncbi:hypothetical protein Q9966_014445 [Columba livia]|nr:hypothetical protein Q9966_014445 [Columba livia]